MSKSSSQSSFDRHMLPQRNDLVSGGKDSTVRTNAYPLNTFVDPGSVRTHREYNWRTGEVNTVSADILDNARKHMARLKTPTVTSARTHPDRDGMYGCNVGMAVPTAPLSGNRKSKSSKKGR